MRIEYGNRAGLARCGAERGVDRWRQRSILPSEVRPGSVGTPRFSRGYFFISVYIASRSLPRTSFFICACWYFSRFPSRYRICVRSAWASRFNFGVFHEDMGKVYHDFCAYLVTVSYIFSRLHFVQFRLQIALILLKYHRYFSSISKIFS